MSFKNKVPEKLVEIKKGQEGVGILIESDGYVSADMTENNKRIVKEASEGIDRGEWNIPNPFVLDVVLQKYGIKNHNGRIYPENILKPEVEKYQKLIKERMALGECYTPDVMVLCEEGWKCMADVTDKDSVLTLNTETNAIEVQKVSRKVEYDYDGGMVSIEGNGISDKVTPNHGYPIYDRCGIFSGFYTADDIFKHEVPDQSNSFIPKQGRWVEHGDDSFILKALDKVTRKKLTKYPCCDKDKKVAMPSFMKFMGLYLSNGSCTKTGNDVRIVSTTQNLCSMIEGLMTELGFDYTVRMTKSGKSTYKISDPRLHSYLNVLGGRNNRHVPSELKRQSRENLGLLYNWFVIGSTDGKKQRLPYGALSESERLSLDLNEIQLKIGYSGEYYCDGGGMYYSLCSFENGICLDDSNVSIKKEPYKGKVMCIEVPNHTFYVMSNGKCHWSKNCNHPAESTIDLGRISHNIIECHWEGHTLVGKIEFNLTEGFRRYGICSSLGDTCANLIMNGYKIGVSSRGVGEVTNRMGTSYVDNYELICWDIVATPSTPGSYIGNREELQQYVEGDTTKNKKSKINEKLDRIKSILGE